jgi:hypothetical protein
LASGVPVWALGGFSGRDPHPTLPEFRAAVAASRTHYLVLSRRGAVGNSPAAQITRWASGTFPATRVSGWLLVDLTGSTAGRSAG